MWCAFFQDVNCSVFVVAVGAGAFSMAHGAVGYIQMLASMSGLGHSKHLRWVAVAGGAGSHRLSNAVIVGCPVEVGVGVAGGAVGCCAGNYISICRMGCRRIAVACGAGGVIGQDFDFAVSVCCGGSSSRRNRVTVSTGR